MVKASVLKGTFQPATELFADPSAEVQGLSFLTAVRLSWLRLELLDDPPAVDGCVLQPGDGSASPGHQPHHTFTKKTVRVIMKKTRRKIKRIQHSIIKVRNNFQSKIKSLCHYYQYYDLMACNTHFTRTCFLITKFLIQCCASGSVCFWTSWIRILLS
jgi:hypothetical protein